MLVPVKQKLTKTHVSRIPPPVPPAARCRDVRGYAVPCNDALTTYTQALLTIVRRQNAKLEEIERITDVEGE